MKLEEIKSPPGANKSPKRVGRGIGSGHGKTSTRGHKGQKARSGGKVRPGFEGGQMPLQRRIPKRGFTNIFKQRWSIVNVKDLNIFEEGTVVTIDMLKQAGLIRKNDLPVKLLGDGEVEKQLTVQVHKASHQAEDKIMAKGGKIEVI